MSLQPGRPQPVWLDSPTIVTGLAALLVVVAVTTVAVDGLVDIRVALVFGAVVALGEIVRVRLPGDRVQAPVGFAAALGYALLGHLPEDARASHSILQTVTVTAVAMVVGSLPHALAGRSPAVESVGRHILVIAAVAAIFRPFVLSRSTFDWLLNHPPSYVVLTVAVAALAWPMEAVLAAGVRAARHQGRLRTLVRNELRAFLGIGSAIASTGVVIALATSEVGLWTLPLFSLPLLLAQFAFRRYAAIRQTQAQTIRALSRATEVGGYTETGHARRVTDLCLAMGQELGLSEERLGLLNYAALMHDIGQLSLADPIPGGATLLVAPDEQRRIATLGGDVIRETGVLDRVATIVEAQAEPYRRPHLPDDTDVPQESRIIKVANAYDDLVGSSTTPEWRVEAIERLRLGMAYEYDPRVVEALARVLARSGAPTVS